jgi:hypothetical protein
MDSASGPDASLTLEQGRRSLSCKSADDPVDQHLVFAIEVFFAEGIRERGDSREFLRHRAGIFSSEGIVKGREKGRQLSPIGRRVPTL